MTHVVDAHVLIWFLERDPKLPLAVADLLRDRTTNLVVPTIVLAEIWHRHERRKTGTSLADTRAIIDSLTNAVIAPFDEAMLSLLPAGLEIHDAIIVPTALLLGGGGRVPVRVITQDRQITASGLVDVLW